MSIVTVVRNNETTIADCISSVAGQSLPPFEHIIIDGKSTDGTLSEIKKHQHSAVKLVSESDKGIYDAMNKGILLATGDIIGILNSDDIYAHSQVLENVTKLFQESCADALFADLVYVKSDNVNQVVRYYSGAGFTPEKFAWGWMPPHPTFFVRREIYERYGLFATDYRISADYELMARFMARHRVNYLYMSDVIVRMRTGGVSTRNLKSNWILNREILRACTDNGIDTNIFKVYSKYFRKVSQLFARPA